MTQSQKEFEAWAKSKNYNLERWGDVLLECWKASRAALVVDVSSLPSASYISSGICYVSDVEDALDAAGVNYK